MLKPWVFMVRNTCSTVQRARYQSTMRKASASVSTLCVVSSSHSTGLTPSGGSTSSTRTTRISRLGGSFWRSWPWLERRISTSRQLTRVGALRAGWPALAGMAICRPASEGAAAMAANSLSPSARQRLCSARMSKWT